MLLHVHRYRDRKSTRLNSSHTEIYTLSLHDALPIFCRTRSTTFFELPWAVSTTMTSTPAAINAATRSSVSRSEEHTSELQSHRDLHSFPTRRSSDLLSHAVHHIF